VVEARATGTGEEEPEEDQHVERLGELHELVEPVR
jgi:hypothetical protein